MARRAKKNTETTPAPDTAAPTRTRGRAAAVAPAPVDQPVKVKSGRATAPQATLEPAPARGKRAAGSVPDVAALRVPPLSKGELRAQVETLEASNAALKTKGRETNRAAKLAARRISELEAQVAQLQEEAAKSVDPAAAIEKLEAVIATMKAKAREASRAATRAERRIAELEVQVRGLETTPEAAEAVAPAQADAEVKVTRRGRPPGRKKVIDPGDAVPPGVAVEDPAPLDAEAEAARHALEENLSREQENAEK